MLVNLFFMAWCRINTVFLFGLVSTVFDETSFFWFIAIIGSWIFVWHFFWLVGLDVVLFLKVILMGSNALVLLLHPEALVSHPLSLFGQHHNFFRLTWCFEILQQLNLYFLRGQLAMLIHPKVRRGFPCSLPLWKSVVLRVSSSFFSGEIHFFGG